MSKCVLGQTSQLLAARSAAPLLSTTSQYRHRTGLCLPAGTQLRNMSNDSSLPWEMVVPQPSCRNPRSTTRHEVLELLKEGQTPGIDLLLVDVRREDHQGPTITGSLNMPIQSVWQSLPTLLRICTGAKINRVIFYCGHSTGRGPRAAALFTDEIAKSNLDGRIQSLVLTDGFNGWSSGGEAFDKYTVR